MLSMIRTVKTITLFCVGALFLTGAALSPVVYEECPVLDLGPDYYTIDLVSTKRIPGSGQAVGKGEVYYASTPFGISLSDDGSYVYNLDISIEKLRPSKRGVYVAWVTTPQIDQIQRIGALSESHKASGTVHWNKFLVVITLEPEGDPDAATWEGPVVLRGISRSGLMHTMAGHGPFEDEPCALYGY